MPQNERVRVFRGELKKTSGGLTAKDLVKNKRGKIVSRKKSELAGHNENNLGSWLRGKGDKFEGKPKAFKGAEPKAEPEAPKKQKKPKQKKPKQKKPKPKKPLEPMKPGEEKNLSKISVGNIYVPKPLTKEERRKKMMKMGMSKERIDKLFAKRYGK